MYILLDSNEGRFAFFQKGDTYDALTWIDVPMESSLVLELKKVLVSRDFVEGIIVRQGKGGFSQTREAVVFANLFAKTEGLPLFAVEDEGKLDLTKLIATLEKSPKTVLMPVYFSEPNITT